MKNVFTVAVLVFVSMFVIAEDAPEAVYNADGEIECGVGIEGVPNCAEYICKNMKFSFTSHWRSKNDPNGGDYARCSQSPTPSDCVWVTDWSPIPEIVEQQEKEWGNTNYCEGIRQKLGAVPEDAN